MIRYRNITPICTLSLLALLALAVGCNVFSPFHNSGASDNVEDLLSDARDALAAGKYQKALGILNKAKSIDPDDARVRYLHACVSVKVNGIDLLEVIKIVEPVVSGQSPAPATEPVLSLTESELVNMHAAFTAVVEDLEPLVDRIVSHGVELNNMRESDDVLMSHGIGQVIVGMLRVLDNDDSPGEFTLDTRFGIVRTPFGYLITLDDELMTLAQIDAEIDQAIERAWPHFCEGRRSLFLYYEFVINERIWTEAVPELPADLPNQVDDATTVGAIADYVNDGLRELYREKEDL